MEEEMEVPEPKSPDNAQGDARDTPPDSTEDPVASAETGDMPQDTEGKLDALKQGLSALQGLAEDIAFKLDHNQRQEELISKLHDENQSYKSGVHQKLVMPLVKEIIFLIDNYTQLYKKHTEKGSEIDTPKLLKQFGEIADDLENVLFKNGFDSYESEEGSVVDFARQKILKTVPTDDPQKDKTVCELLKKGFILEDKIIRQEQVSCYKFEENPSTKKE